MENTRLIIAYGSPGTKLANTFGNIAYMFLDHAYFRAINITPTLAIRQWVTKSKYMFSVVNSDPVTLIVKPRTYPKDFVHVARDLFLFYHPLPQDFYVVYPSLDINFGEYKITSDPGKFAPENVEKLSSMINNNDYLKVRIGVGQGGIFSKPSPAIFDKELGEADRSAITLISQKLGMELGLIPKSARSL